MPPTRRTFLTQSAAALAAATLAHAADPRVPTGTKDDGYRGIWFELGQKSQFGDKYSGGLGTYTANHVPMAIYAKAVDKTFFVYGGTLAGKRHLLALASYFDHQRHVVPRPTVVHDKQTVNDPHDNPALSIDGEGFLWVFVSGRAKVRPGLIYRSAKPYSTDAFELIGQHEFTYPQPRWFPGVGFVLLHTKYTKGRELYVSTSADGRQWTPAVKFAGMGGHYQTSHVIGQKIITAFNMHPGGNVDKRTNLYYLQTDDFGRTWRNVAGETVTLPLADPHNPALVRDYQAERELVYIHDLDLDADGAPVIVYTTSRNFVPGPSGDPRVLTSAHWRGGKWEYTPITKVGHNYSTGSLYLEPGAPWRYCGPTQPGPQPVGSGGEVALWRSADRGASWTKERDVTAGSALNHNYVRRPLHAHPDFWAYWADGNPDQFSRSCLYFTNQTGDKVWRLPYDMAGAEAAPEVVRG